MADALRLAGVNTYYGASHVLHDVSFALPEGRVLGLLGRNGVGKTTTIRSIIGFTPPRAGAIQLWGEPIARLAPEHIARRGIGLVPQGRAIFPSLTVQENLTVAARHRAPWTLERVRALFPRLGERSRQLAGTLSGGEQQMLAIARALMTNPRVLLMDEPSEGLAPTIVAEIQRTLLALKGEGLSILLVEQNTPLALSLADAVVVLNGGRVVYDGPPARLTRDEAFVALHLGVY